MKQWIAAIAGIMMLAAGCKKDEAPATQFMGITIAHKAGSADLQLGQVINTPLGEPISINVFRYYLSNFSLLYTDGSEKKLADTYFLVNQLHWVY